MKTASGWWTAPNFNRDPAASGIRARSAKTFGKIKVAVNEKLYFFLRNAVEIFARVNNRFEVEGAENLPGSSGALLCPNHENFSDPFFVAAAVKNRPLHFLAWHGIGEMPLVGPVFTEMGTMHSIKESYGVSLDKEEAKATLGEMGELLRAGELCVIFPEGVINHWIGHGGVKEFKPGAVRLAASAGVPIIPIGLKGTRWVVPNLINPRDFGGPDKGYWIPIALPSKVRMKIGKSFAPEPASAVDKSVCVTETERLRETIMQLIDSIK
jgi:1-acyl-sn-glycerol-3-phosphate acyltransferase